MKNDDHLLVMGMCFRVGITVREVLAPVFAKVKSKYWSMKHMFRAKVPLAGRLKLMDKVLGNTALWCASAFQPDQMALQTVNVLQSQLVIWSMRLAKGRGEDWIDFRIRSFRAARWAIHRFMGMRWSTRWLQRTWDYTGHSFRTLEWWQTEQQRKSGMRHPGRFFPRLMGNERDLDAAAGGPWRDKAMDREGWRVLRQNWVNQQNLPWSSHTQLAIEV